LIPTVPLPVPLDPLVTVSQDVALLTAVHVHPAAVVTPIDPALAAAVAVVVNGETVYAHGAEKVNVFEGPLAAVPPGPTAATRDS
jgi:CubicO group peptidase (beta-lactamase class C family)